MFSLKVALVLNMSVPQKMLSGEKNINIYKVAISEDQL